MSVFAPAAKLLRETPGDACACVAAVAAPAPVSACRAVSDAPMLLELQNREEGFAVVVWNPEVLRMKAGTEVRASPSVNPGRRKEVGKKVVTQRARMKMT